MTETALSTALNMSYMATNSSLFSLVVGIALLLSGVGFIVLALAALRSKSGDGGRDLGEGTGPQTRTPVSGEAEIVATGLTKDYGSGRGLFELDLEVGAARSSVSSGRTARGSRRRCGCCST